MRAHFSPSLPSSVTNANSAVMSPTNLAAAHDKFASFAIRYQEILGLFFFHYAKILGPLHVKYREIYTRGGDGQLPACEPTQLEHSLLVNTQETSNSPAT